jgi:putative DNA primase/helicase
LFDDVMATDPLAVHPSGDVWLYREGRFVFQRQALTWLVADRLGDAFKPDHLRNFVAYAAAALSDDGQALSTEPTTPLVNVANGMLDLATGRLAPHDPSYRSIVQLPVAWDAKATCPSFDDWFARQVPIRSRRDGLLEDVSEMLTTGSRQRKAVYLVGPSRTGKSTFARLMEQIAGAGNCSAEELADLSTNRFRAAQLFGKILNVASDIRSPHLTDVSVFKKATGDDTISAEHKFGHPFQFRFRGVFLWTMNEVPTLSGATTAYLARVRCYRFDQTFLGAEDASIEAAMTTELPGILRRLVEAQRRLVKRGRNLEDDAATADARWLAQRSDAVRLFLSEACGRDGFTTRPHVYDGYLRWTRESGHKALGRRRFYDAIEQSGIPMKTVNGYRGFGLHLVDDPIDDGAVP